MDGNISEHYGFYCDIENSNNKWYCGHIPNFNVNNISKIENKYTILRDPFDKLISSYEFFKLRRHLSSNKLILNLGLNFTDFCNTQIPEIRFSTLGSYVRWFNKKDNLFDINNPKSYDINYIEDSVWESLHELNNFKFIIQESVNINNYTYKNIFPIWNNIYINETFYKKTNNKSNFRIKN